MCVYLMIQCKTLRCIEALELPPVVVVDKHTTVTPQDLAHAVTHTRGYTPANEGPCAGLGMGGAVAALNDALTVNDDKTLSTVEEINRALRVHDAGIQNITTKTNKLGEIDVSALKEVVGMNGASIKDITTGTNKLGAIDVSNLKEVVDTHDTSIKKITTSTNKLGAIDVSALKGVVDTHDTSIKIGRASCRERV